MKNVIQKIMGKVWFLQLLMVIITWHLATLDNQAEERSSTNVPTTPNLGSGSSCNLVCTILIIISVTGLCIIITYCLISLRNQSTKETNKTENVDLGSESNTEKIQTETTAFTVSKAEENSNMQENIFKKRHNEDVESSQSVKVRTANESSPRYQGIDEEDERSEDYSRNEITIQPGSQPASKDVCKEQTRSEDCQQSVTDSLNGVDDKSGSTTVTQHPARQNHTDVDYHIEQHSPLHVTIINVKNK